jgi:hypothetical protein
MKAYWGVEVSLHAFLISELDGSESLASDPGRFIPMKRVPGTHRIRGREGPQNRSRRVGEEKNSEPQPGLEPTIIQPAAQQHTTELPRLRDKFREIFQNKTLRRVA